MQNIYIKDDFIKLGQAMKLANIVYSGADAKEVINEGLVEVNGEICTMRGKKLVEGDIFSFEGQEIKVNKR